MLERDIQMIAAENGSVTGEVGSPHNASRRLPKTTRAKRMEKAAAFRQTQHPTLANYRRVLSVLRKTGGLWERVNKRDVVGVFAPDRQAFEFPQDVTTVTEKLHEQGLNLATVPANRILHEAIRIILKDNPPASVVWKQASRVMSFRIPKESADVLEYMMKERQIVGISSCSQFVRRLALDFAAQRLDYPDALAPKVDWEKLQIKGVATVRAV
jgi:hypothetical protein